MAHPRSVLPRSRGVLEAPCRLSGVMAIPRNGQPAEMKRAAGSENIFSRFSFGLGAPANAGNLMRSGKVVLR